MQTLEFRTILKAAHEKKGLSLREAAGKLGTVKSYLSDILQGTVAAPSPELVRKMARFYGLDAVGLVALAEASKTDPAVRKIFSRAATAFILGRSQLDQRPPAVTR
jgi:transcriptional regulator with XRE-family HTH domain